MNENDFTPIEQVLREKIGLDPSSLGPKGAESAISARMRNLGISEPSAYAVMVAASPEELETLIEHVVIPETWFFRDREPFLFLADFIRSEWQTGHAGETLRILSVPCSSGEEPYSIAMTCLDCGQAAARFSIEGMDISDMLLRKARNAVYGRNSFRGMTPEIRDRFFTPQENNYSLKTEIRECVRFFKTNILEPENLPAPEHYNVIFCRNLLIYLHEQARAKVLDVIDRLLTGGGLLFLGHAEATPFIMEKYEIVRHRGSFAYRKPLKDRTETERQSRQPFSEVHVGPLLVRGRPIQHGKDRHAAFRQAQGPEQSRRTSGGPTKTLKFLDIKLDPSDKNHAPLSGKDGQTVSPQKTALKNADALDHATQLADEGRLEEACAACSAVIKADRQNASAHFLMGLIMEAQGDNRAAEECFNRAIYLDTDFSDAILHLAALKEEDGDPAGAETLRRRAGLIIQRT